MSHLPNLFLLNVTEAPQLGSVHYKQMNKSCWKRGFLRHCLCSSVHKTANSNGFLRQTTPIQQFKQKWPHFGNVGTNRLTIPANHDQLFTCENKPQITCARWNLKWTSISLCVGNVNHQFSRAICLLVGSCRHELLQHWSQQAATTLPLDTEVQD